MMTNHCSRLLHVLGLISIVLQYSYATISQSSGNRDGAEKKPNFLLFVVDDMGYGDLGCYGRQNISTPNVDRLASEGIRFTQWIR